MNHTEFTDEEFEASDTLIDPEFVNDGKAMMSMSKIEFAVSHSHDTESITLSTRFVEQYLTPDGFTAERPKQITIPIPIDHWHSIMLEAMVNIGCIITAKEAGETSHDG